MMIVNNTGQDIRLFDAVLQDAAQSKVFPEVLENLFTLKFIEVDGEERMIVDFQD